MRAKTLFIFFLLLQITLFAQSVSGGGRVINMKNYWSSQRAYTSELGIDINSEVNKIYLDVKSGPYLENKWFKGTVTTLSGDRIEDDEIEYRFDKYLHALHFRKIGEEKVEVMPTETYKGFTLLGEQEFEFVKLLPPLSPVYREAKFYEALSSGSGGKLMKLHYSQLESYQVAGPSNDGRTRNRFKSTTVLFVEVSLGTFKEVKPKKKSILSVFPEHEEKLASFEKKNGKIKTEQALVEFLSII